MRDNHLKKEEYFYTEKYDAIKMVSTNITSKMNNQYEGIFDLHLKGKVKKLVVPFVVSLENKMYTFKGEFTLNRLDFGVGGKSWIMGNEVTVFVEFSSIP